MKHLVTLIALVTLLALSHGCRRHASTVAPYGWPSITPAFDSLTVKAENLYFIAADPDSLESVINSMRRVASGLKGEKGIRAHASADYWNLVLNVIKGQTNEVDSIMKAVTDSVKKTHPEKDDYIYQRFCQFGQPYFNPTSIKTFKELLEGLDYYRNRGDHPQAGNIAVLISNSLQFANAPNLALHYLQMADSLYALSGQEERRMNVRLNEPNVLCIAGYLDEGREKMDVLLRDSNVTSDPFTSESLYRNHYYFFNDTVSLFKGYALVKVISEDPYLRGPFSEIKALYEALLCSHYMNAGRLDSAARYYDLFHGVLVQNMKFKDRILSVTSRYLESIGNDREALNVLRQDIAVMDTINKANDPEKKEYLERVNVLRQHEEEAEREKRDIERKHHLIAAILVFLLLLAVIAVQWIRHRNKVRTIAMQLEAEKMERQILAMSLSKEESDKVLDKVKEETARLKQEGTVSAKDLSEIETNIKLHMAAKDEMQAFEKAFAEVSPDFAERLKELSPTISSNNIRLCTYLYMGLSGQQVCSILNITPGALRQAKRRLRQRFGLAGDDSIEDFLRSLVK